MRLTAFLEIKGISDADFGQRIGVSRQAVHRYKSGERVPDQPTMAKIAEETGGEVLPNDFFNLPDLQNAPEAVAQ